MKLTKIKSLLIACAAGVLMLAPAAADAAVIQSDDGVFSIETPDDSWTRTMDPNSQFVISNGRNSIVVDHLSNGVQLPGVEVANGSSYKGVAQVFVSTENEVFVVKGMAAERAELESLMKIIGTLKVMKYDTKTAVGVTPAPAASQFGLREINQTYYCNGSEVRVRSSWTNSDASNILGELDTGDQVRVLGMVTFNGTDYNWYQIEYKDQPQAYVSAQFLSPNRTGSGSAPSFSVSSAVPSSSSAPSSSSGKSIIGAGFTVYDENGNIQGMLVPYSDGYYYSNDMQPYSNQGSGVYYGVRTGDLLWSFNPAESSGSSSDIVPIGEGFTVYNENGINEGLLVPYSDGYYYSNDMQPYSSQGSGVYYGVRTGDILWSFNPAASSAYDQQVAKEEEDRNTTVVCEYCGAVLSAGNDYRNHVLAMHSAQAAEDNENGVYSSNSSEESYSSDDSEGSYSSDSYGESYDYSEE